MVQFYLTRKYLGEAGVRAATVHAAGSDAGAGAALQGNGCDLWIGVGGLGLGGDRR